MGDDATTDSDCKAACGNGVVEGSEKCDGACPTSCNDSNGCTNDVLGGSSTACSAQCQFEKNTSLCSNGTCVNASGSFTCTCNSGFIGSGTQSCTPSRYKTTADTVSDSTTGLVWQRVVPSPASCGGTQFCTWDAAGAYCESLTLAGASNWRLPSINELKGLVVLGVDPTIDSVAFPNTPSDFFWTGELADATMPTDAWEVNFASGQAGTKATGRAYEVRCVH